MMQGIRNFCVIGYSISFLLVVLAGYMFGTDAMLFPIVVTIIFVLAAVFATFYNPKKEVENHANP